MNKEETSCKHEERGALDIIITNEPDPAFPDEKVIDIVYHGTDIGIKFYLSHDTEEFYQALDKAEEFCEGYNKALKDVERLKALYK